MDDFTLTGYRKLIVSLLERGYAVRTYDSAATDRQHLVLRHDVDMTLDSAVTIAGIENELGVTANYFVLLRSEFYNLHTPGNVEALHRLGELGHDIGLHFDASLYGQDADAIESAASRECDMLEGILGKEVQSISFHRPARALLGYEGKIAGRLHSYQPKFFSQMGYCSDSRGGWHHGHPMEHDAVQMNQALQLLTHPVWWCRTTSGDPVTMLDKFRIDCDLAIAKELSRNCEPYRERYGANPVSLADMDDE